MSGIVANISYKKTLVEKSVINKALDLLKHRGNDQIGKYTSELCHLSVGNSGNENLIVDNLPYIKTIDKKKIVVICNAEIYNRDELRNNLLKLNQIAPPPLIN